MEQVAERKYSRRGRRPSMPAAERPLAAQTHLRPWVLDRLRAEADRLDRSLSSLIAESCEAWLARLEEERRPEGEK